MPEVCETCGRPRDSFFEWMKNPDKVCVSDGTPSGHVRCELTRLRRENAALRACVEAADAALADQDADDDCPCSMTHMEANDAYRAARAELAKLESTAASSEPT